MLARMINHNAPHQLHGHSDKVGPSLPDRLRIINQLQLGFVENGRRLQCVAGPLPVHVMVGEPMQFGCTNGNNFSNAPLISAAPVAE